MAQSQSPMVQAGGAGRRKPGRPTGRFINPVTNKNSVPNPGRDLRLEAPVGRALPVPPFFLPKTQSPRCAQILRRNNLINE